MTTPYIDPNLIFAENAPVQDKPAAFSNYDKGWDESRKNDGRPLIPQMNYLTQQADLKNLYIHENGAALPYKDGITYEENSVVVKDGVLQQWKSGGWVQLNSAGAILDASGKTQQEINDNQAQINARTVTPYDFGAIGDGTSHKLSERYATLADAQTVYPHAVSLDDELDWCAIQAFANLYVNSGVNRKINFVMSGHFYVNRTCDFTIKSGTTYSGAYKIISGDQYFTTRSDFIGKTVLAFNGRGSCLTGVLYIKGGNFVDYGIIFADRSQPNTTTSIAFGGGGFKIFVDDVRIRAVQFDSNAMFSSVELIRGGGCGTSFDVTATSITNRTINTLDTRSDIILAADVDLPDLTDVNVFVTRGRDVSIVVSYDPTTRKLEVKNAFADTSTSGAIRLFYGGLVGIRGSDSAGIKLGVCSGIYTPIVVENSAMYSIDIAEIVSEYAQCSIYDNGLVGGLNIGLAYYEGDRWQYISNNSSAGTYGFTHIGKVTGFNIEKFINIAYPTNADGIGNSTYDGLRGVRIAEKNVVHRYEKPSYNRVPNNTYLNMNTPFEVFNRQFNSGVVQFLSINKQYNKLFGYDYKQVVVHGTGLDAIPTGSISFRPPEGWTINGSTDDVAFSGFTGPAKFDVKLRPATNDINITCSNLQSTKKGTTAQRPSNPQIGTRYYDTTLLATGKPIEYNGTNWVDATGAAV